MPALYQKPGGIGYVTAKDVTSTAEHQNDQFSTPERWSAERIQSLEFDSLQCLKVAAEVLLLSEVATPLAIFRGVLGGHQCVTNLMGDFFASDRDNSSLHQVTNLFDPLGLQLGIIGGLFFGQRGLVAGAEAGAFISGAHSYATDLGKSEAMDYLGGAKLSEDLGAMGEDLKKLWDEWQQRLGDHNNLESPENNQSNDVNGPTPDTTQPDQISNPDQPFEGDFEPPFQMPNGDGDFVLA